MSEWKADPKWRLLVDAGPLLCDPDRWQRQMAALLLVDDRLLRRWVAGTREIPQDKAWRIECLLMAQMDALGVVLKVYRDATNICNLEPEQINPPARSTTGQQC